MTEPELDTAIDRAVRDLMTVDADSAFRTRVTARLERPARRREGWTWLPRLLTVVVTAAAIIAGLIWMRPSTSDAPESTAARGGVQPAPVAAPPAPRHDGSPPPRVRRAEELAPPAIARAASVGAIPPGIIVATAVEPSSDALPPLEPIEVPPIAQTRLASANIVVAELSPIAELQVSPLEPPTGR